MNPPRLKPRWFCRLFGCRNGGYPIPPGYCEMCGRKTA